MEIDSLILAITGAAWVVLAIWLFIVSLSIRKINKRGKTIAKAGESGDFVGAVENSLSELSLLHDTLMEIKVKNNEIEASLGATIQRVGVVRFDAFDDIGGKLSFAVALLNSYGDGVVVSTINGRHESRSYAKALARGESEYTLSAEEEQAIEIALSSRGKSKSAI